MHRAGLLFLATAVSASAMITARAAPIPVNFPAALDQRALSDWLRANNLGSRTVIGINSLVVTSISADATASRGRMLDVRADVVSPASYAQRGVAVYVMSVEADCRARKVRLGRMGAYATRDAAGAPVQARPADTGWRSPEPRTSLESAWRFKCDKRFRPPSRPHTLMAQAPADARLQMKAAPRGPMQTEAPREAERAAADAAARQPITPSSRRSRLKVQVIASQTEAEARQALTRAQGKVRDHRPMNATVERARVRNGMFYRGAFEGFANLAEANAFCSALKRAGEACFVRRAN